MRSISFFLLLLATVARAQTDHTLKLPASLSGKPNEIVRVPVALSTDSLIQRMQFIVQFDSSILRFNSALLGSATTNFTIVELDSSPHYLPNAEGTNKNLLLQIAATDTHACKGNDLDVVHLQFKVEGRFGKSSLIFNKENKKTFLATVHLDTIANEKIDFIDGLLHVIPDTSAILSLHTDTLNILEGVPFPVLVQIEDIWDLYSIESNFSFDPDVLRVDSVTVGPFLDPDGVDSLIWQQPILDNISGNILNIRCSRTTEPGIDGSGVLATIHFRAHTPGTSTINFLRNQTYLYSSAGYEIPIKSYIPIDITVYRNPVVELSLPDTFAAPNQLIDIPIAISGVKNASIISVLMSVSVDTNCLIPEDVITTNTLVESWSPPIINKKGSKILFAMAGYFPLDADGVLIRLRYQVNTKAKEDDRCTITITQLLLNEGDPTTIITHGHFRVRGFQLAGNVAYNGTVVPVPGVDLQIRGQLNISGKTGSDGNFSFSQLHYGNYELKFNKRGDQGVSITPFDAALILQHAVQLNKLTPYQMIAADVTGDSTVSPLDASSILRLSVGLIDQFPIMEDQNDFWRFVPLSFSLNDTNWFMAPSLLTYAPLSSDKFNQDFRGIIYGDVSQNWTSPATRSPFSPPDKDNVAHLYFGTINENSKSTIQLPILISKASDIISIQLQIKFNANQLRLLSIEPSEISHDFSTAYHVVDETIKISMARATSEELEGTLLTLTFHRYSDTDNHFEFQRAELNEGRLPIVTNVLSISKDMPLPTHYRLWQNYPNPFNQSTVFKIEIPVAARVDFAIYNLSGQRLCTLMDEKQEPGYYTFHWVGRDAFQNPIASGVYLAVLETDQVRLTRKILFMK